MEPVSVVRSVVITRPAAQAGELVRGIAALGRHAVLFPLLDILPLADVTPLRAALADLQAQPATHSGTQFGNYALVAFVSPNAISAALGEMPAWPAGLPIAVMGEGSRRILGQYGIDDGNTKIYSPHGTRTDSETLLASLDLAALRGRKVLIIRGESGRELLADRLREQGVEVQQLAAYRRAIPAFDDMRRAQLAALLEGKNDWIVTSSEALRNLVQWGQQLQSDGQVPHAVAKMQQQRLVLPHARIAETAQSEGFLDIHMSASGDEALLAALQSAL